MAVKTLKDNGRQVTLDQATAILELMYDFANLAVNQQLQKQNEVSDPLIRRPGPG
ncbi:hypothetical protein D3C72_2254840 [compost metagenome]